MSKARDIADLGSVTTRLDEVGNTDGALSNRNLIINGAMQVAQRGTSFTNYGGYTLDRWFIGNPGTNSISQGYDATINSNYISITTSSTWGMFQRIEDKNVKHLKTGDIITVSQWTTSPTGYADLKSQDGTNLLNLTTVTVETAGSWYKRVTTGEVPSGVVSNIQSGGYFYCGIEGGLSSFKVTQVQLEVGDTATPFEHRSYGDELARCQRYYEIGVIFGQYKASDDTGGWAHYKVTKRVNPSIQIYPPDFSQVNHAYYYSTSAADRGDRLVNEINPSTWFAGQTDYTAGLYAIMGGFTPVSDNDATWVGNYQADAEL